MDVVDQYQMVLTGLETRPMSGMLTMLTHS